MIAIVDYDVGNVGSVLNMLRKVDAQAEQAPHLFHGRDTAAVAQRHEALAGDIFDELEVRFAFFLRCGDVEQDQFVDFLFVEDLDGIDRISDISGVFELDRLVQTAAAQQQAGDDASL